MLKSRQAEREDWGGGVEVPPPFGTHSLVPVGRLLQHLVEAKSEGLVLKAFLNKVLVDPELSRRNELPLRDAREVEAELPSVLLVEIFITVHCGKERGEKKTELAFTGWY